MTEAPRGRTQGSMNWPRDRRSSHWLLPGGVCLIHGGAPRLSGAGMVPEMTVPISRTEPYSSLLLGPSFHIRTYGCRCPHQGPHSHVRKSNSFPSKQPDKHPHPLHSPSGQTHSLPGLRQPVKWGDSSQTPTSSQNPPQWNRWASPMRHPWALS